MDQLLEFFDHPQVVEMVVVVELGLLQVKAVSQILFHLLAFQDQFKDDMQVAPVDYKVLELMDAGVDIVEVKIL
jgi:hypothetical protein